MESWEINGYMLEYDDSTHTYLVDGVIVPSVTQVLDIKFGGKYASVNPSILNRAANRGTSIHKAIEDYCKGNEELLGTKEVRNFKFLQRHYNFEVIENETPIVITKEGNPIVAGRLDLVLGVHEITALADIKTVSALDKEYLAYQLNLYRIGYIQSYGTEIKELYGVHLREDKRKFIKIPIDEARAWNILEQYERSKNE